MQLFEFVRNLVDPILTIFIARNVVVTPSSFAASEFDVIIVGGGTAGLVVANRLTAPTSTSARPLRVGVIDAGRYAPLGDPLIDIPYGANIFMRTPESSMVGNPEYDWMYQTVPQPALEGHVIGYPRGKVLGGSSALHAMAWQRGSRADYDVWGSAFGNGDEWNFDGLLPYFQRAENWTAPPTGADALLPGTDTIDPLLASAYGKHGPLPLSYSSYVTDLDRPLTEASVKLGFPLNDNPDAGNSNYLPRHGIARTLDPTTGKRGYAASAYFGQDVSSRNNLVVLTGALATRIIWDNSTLGTEAIQAKGVEYVVGDESFVVEASKEVILCAGSLKTPQLLELSGVGKASLLKGLGVPVILDLPQVGENLMDHPVSISDFKVKNGVETLDWLAFNQTHFQKHQDLYNNSRTGAFTYTPRITGGWPLKDLILADEYKKMRSELDVTLSRLTTTPLQRAQYEALKKMADGGNVAWFMPAVIPRGGMISAPKPETGYVTVIGFQLHEFARGSVHINSTDPMAPPVIDNRFLSLPWDLDVQTHGMQFIRRWIQTEPAASLIDELVTPPASTQSHKEWTGWIKKTIWSMAHPMGSTAMASERLGGVVNPRLKVYGIKNVRIVDAGIIPMTIGAPIQSVVYALAEKGAAMIAEDLNINAREIPLRKQEL